MDGHPEPPSPAPSLDTSGLGQITENNAAPPFPGYGSVTKKSVGATPQSYTPYGSSPAHHDIGELGSMALISPLRAEEAHVQPRPYATPETLPAIASQTNRPRTRSTTRLLRPSGLSPMDSKGNRVAKSAPKKKRERSRAVKRASRVLNALSVLAHNHPDIAIADIASYVHRPTEVRKLEVKQNKIPGKVKRPMNAFMLYRKAYQGLAKELCTKNNHQIVSQVCGDGWPLEPESVRDQFTEWARIERENHHHAHPDYKFSPSKPARKPKRTGNELDDGTALADPDYAPSRVAQVSGNKEKTRHGQIAGAGDAPVSIYGTHDAYGSQNWGMPLHPNQPVHQYGTLGEPIAVSYENTGIVGAHYYQQNIHHPMSGRGGSVEDALIGDTPSPAAYGRGEQDAYHGRPSQYPPIPRHVIPEQAIDPSLVERPEQIQYDDAYGGLGLNADRQWHGQQEVSNRGALALDESMAPLESLMVQDSQFNYLRDGWQVQGIGGHHTHFDDWTT